LLAAYYERLATRCRSLPLQGIYEQRSNADSLMLDLEQVYTHLATTDHTPRERVDRATLATFDVAAYLAQHTGDHLLPRDQRTLVEPVFPVTDDRDEAGSAHGEALVAASDPAGMPGKMSRLRDGPVALSRARLIDDAKVAEELTFLGPMIVTEAIAAKPHLVLLGEPGSGKSTALRYLAYTLARAGLDAQVDLAALLPGWTLGRLVPIVVPLLPLAQAFAAHPARRGEADDLWHYLVAHLQPEGASPGLAAAVHEELEAGRVILLLDGLDEVAGAESRRKVVRAVQSFAQRFRRIRMVVACRVR
ncbi:NACHT domain-containing protein, partial [Candidatus Chloroploca asiatica]|uniref:NACHT domain-containing protein n=1 Tax=Candidatus Chloroploca asiatica TaxID=1506545 RepID=UPI003CCBC81E